MMEPLSITMAVIGLLKTAHEVSLGITRLVASKKNGSNEIREIKTTVDTLRSVLLQLQLLLLNHGKIDERRASMILVDEVVVTLTACVMTFSDLDSCVEGLEADEKLGILGSVRWASRSADFARYKRELEAHKSSLSLMVNILSCQAAHNLANDAAELKVMMVRVLESNKVLAERIAVLEVMPGQHSLEARQDQEVASTYGQDTANGLDVDTPEPYPANGPKGHPAFEEDLSKSWVYQRSLVRGPRTFSIATSKRLTQVTQSWSVLSGISLSQISNIAIQSLPIFQEDLKVNHLYEFGVVNHASGTRADLPSFLLRLAEKHPPILRKMPAIEHLKSEPYFPDSKFNTYSSQVDPETATLPNINEESPQKTEFLLPELDFSLPISEIDSLFKEISEGGDEATAFVPHSSSEIALEATDPKVLITTSTPSNPAFNDSTTLSSFKVLYIAASLFEFHIDVTKWEAGYPYLTYMAGFVFDIMAEKGELWLAINQDDPSQEVGWVWCKHFAKIDVDELSPQASPGHQVEQQG